MITREDKDSGGDIKGGQAKRRTLLRSCAKYRSAVSKVLLLTLIVFSFGLSQSEADAAGSLTLVKDTLTNNRPSVATSITSAITTGDTTITVASTQGIVQGDSVVLKDGALTEIRVVAAVASSTQLVLTIGTTNSYTTAGSVYLKITSKHTLNLTTRSGVSAGKFIVYIPADTSPSDTIPAAGGFDFNQIAASDISLTGGTAGTVTTSASGNNLIFTIPFTGTISSSTAVTITIGNNGKLLNPTKTATSGTADTYTVKVDETDGASNVIDTSSLKIGTIESVVVSATVAPSLTFTINGVAAGANGLAYNSDITSTSDSVPFGTLTPNATSTIEQYINISTNSDSGYVVTAQQDGSMRKTNGTAIADFDSSAPHENESTTGFGYTLANKVGNDAAFHYNDSGHTFNSKGFSSTTPFPIMSSTGPVNGNQVYVGYRVKVSSTQAAGNYQNLITYIATPSY